MEGCKEVNTVTGWSKQRIPQEGSVTNATINQVYFILGKLSLVQYLPFIASWQLLLGPALQAPTGSLHYPGKDDSLWRLRSTAALPRGGRSWGHSQQY